MSLNYANVQEAANEVFLEPIQDLVARSNPFLAGMQKKAVGSDRLYMKYKGASEHNAGPIADGADITFVGDERTTRSAAALDWSTYKAQFNVSKRAISQLKENPGAIGQLLGDEIQDAALDLADRISTDVFSAGVTNGLVGLGAIIDDANTYAGVDRSLAANENWRSTIVDNATAAPAAGEISTDVLYDADTAFFNRNFYGLRDQAARRNYMGFCTPEVLDKYSRLFTSINLTDLSTAHFVNQANASGNFGQTMVSWMGIPMMRDRAVAALAGDEADSGRLYFVDMNEIFLATLGSSEEAAIHQRLGAQSAPTVDNLNFEIEILGNTGENVKGYVKTYIQVCAPAPKRAGVGIKNILTV